MALGLGAVVSLLTGMGLAYLEALEEASKILDDICLKIMANTEIGFDGYRNQIKRAIETMQVAPTFAHENGLSSN